MSLTYANSPPISTSSPRESVHEAGSIEGNSGTGGHKPRPQFVVPPQVIVPPQARYQQQQQQKQQSPRADDGADVDPLMLQADGQSMAFWNMSNWNPAAGNSHVGPDSHSGPTEHCQRRRSQTTSMSSIGSVASAVSALSSEIEDEREREAARRAQVHGGDDGQGVGGGGENAEQALTCRNCGSGNFKATNRARATTTTTTTNTTTSVGEMQRLICAKYVLSSSLPHSLSHELSWSFSPKPRKKSN